MSFIRTGWHHFIVADRKHVAWRALVSLVVGVWAALAALATASIGLALEFAVCGDAVDQCSALWTAYLPGYAFLALAAAAFLVAALSLVRTLLLIAISVMVRLHRSADVAET